MVNDFGEAIAAFYRDAKKQANSAAKEMNITNIKSEGPHQVAK